MELILGLDEAGRGPLIGPLVMAGVLIEKNDESKLKSLGVKDSKLLTKEKREELFDSIIKISKKHKIIITDVEEIDKAVNGEKNLNLNKLEGNKIIKIINELKPDTAIIDCPSNNKEAFKKYLKAKIKPKTKLILEHKADYKYPIVAAASILAKVTRDNEIEKLKNKINLDFGSGYPSDPKTIEFLNNHYKTHKDIFRKSWTTYKNKIYSKNQTSLGDFSNNDKIQHNPIIEKLKRLEKLEYISIPVKTEHEKLRLKGEATVTLYKNGKILIQGKDEYKKKVEKLLK